MNGEASGPVKRTPKWYVMIAWAAISFVMLIQGAAGLFIGWSGGDTEPFSHISLFSIIISAVGGIALVEMLRRLAERPDDQGKDMTTKPQVNLKGIAIYIVIVVLVLFVGYPLRDSLPVFYLAPWVSLVIGIVGLALLRPLFGQKKQTKRGHNGPFLHTQLFLTPILESTFQSVGVTSGSPFSLLDWFRCLIPCQAFHRIRV